MGVFKYSRFHIIRFNGFSNRLVNILYYENNIEPVDFIHSNIHYIFPTNYTRNRISKKNTQNCLIFITYDTFFQHRVEKKNNMNAWVSDTCTVFGLIFPFMKLKDIQTWRFANKHAQYLTSVYTTPDTWEQTLLRHPGLQKCAACDHIRKKYYMFQCPQCHKYVCGGHVVSCNMCNYDICHPCALQGNTPCRC